MNKLIRFVVVAWLGVLVAIQLIRPARTNPATDLATAGVQVSAEMVFAALTDAMLFRLQQWARGDGFPA